MRCMLRNALVLLGFALVWQVTATPNLIYILADDLGCADIGCYGGTVIQTPGLDQMRAEGLKRTQHDLSSCRRAPTRWALLTGQHTGHTRIRHNGSS